MTTRITTTTPEDNECRNTNSQALEIYLEKVNNLIYRLENDQCDKSTQSGNSGKAASSTNQISSPRIICKTKGRKFLKEKSPDEYIEYLCSLGPNRINPILEWQVFMISKMTSHINGIPYSCLNSEQYRLYTFNKYPHEKPKSSLLLAADGWSYYGDGTSDEVHCYFCTTNHKNWDKSDDIHSVHSAISPTCPMVTKDERCTNIPLEKKPLDSSLFKQIEPAHSQKRRNSDIESDAVDFSREVSDAAPSTSQASTANPKSLEKFKKHKHLSIPRRQQARSRSPSDQPRTPYTITAHQATDAEGPEPGSENPKHLVLTSSNAITSSGVAFPSQGLVATTASELPANTSAASTSASNTTALSNTASSNTASANTATSAAGSQVPSQSAATPVSANQGSESGSTAMPAEVPSTNSNNQPAEPTPSSTPATSGGQSQPTNGGQASSTGQSTGQATGTTTSGQSDTRNNRRSGTAAKPTYQQLGIITERPKRFEYALRQQRIRSYDDWPRGHHLSKESLSEAGFYFAGYGDCARCFYCGGGLRNWEPTDNVWVEHARWFPKCAYLRQTVGQAFVDAVKRLNDENRELISYDDVMTELAGTPAGEFLMNQQNTNPLESDAAVLAVVEMGYRKEDAVPLAQEIKSDEGLTLTAETLLTKLQEKKKPRSAGNDDGQIQSVSRDLDRDRATISTLKERIGEMRQQTVCKVCLDKEVSVVFLPCGHFCSCSECASALEACPVCRQNVRGIVKTYMK